jgi:hypothetical protein
LRTGQTAGGLDNIELGEGFVEGCFLRGHDPYRDDLPPLSVLK